MHPTTHPARRGGHLSRHERQRLARAAAFSRRTALTVAATAPVKLDGEDLELIDRLIRHDRTAVSTALLAIAGIGAGEASRRTVLSRVGDAASWAQAEGAISPARASQIARHVRYALGGRPRDGRLTSVSASVPSPTVEAVLRFEDLPLGSLASRRAVVRWSDGTESEALRWVADEVMVCEGDLIGQTREQLRSLHFRRDRDWLQS